MGSEKRPPATSVGGAWRDFFGAGGPSEDAPTIPDFDELCLDSSVEWRRADFGPTALDPRRAAGSLMRRQFLGHSTYLRL